MISHATLACLIAIAIAMHMPIVEMRPWNLLVYGICLLTALSFRLRWATQVALLMVLVAGLNQTPALRDSIGQSPVLPLLVPLIVSSIIVWAWPATRPTLRWMRLGEVDRAAWATVALTGIASAAALIVWASWTDNFGIGEQMMASAVHYPVWLLACIAIPAFALFNAVTEEAVFRGMLQSALAESSKSSLFVIIVQAAAFAAVHYEVGFPNGPIGYAMVFSYGVLLGTLRLRTNGLLAPVAAHAVADLVIGYVLLIHATST